MKNTSIFASSILLAMLLLAGKCSGGGDNPDPATPTELLTQTWQVSNVISGSISESTANFRITFTETTYTISNPAPAIPSPNNTSQNTSDRTSGSWVFANSNGLIIFDSADTATVVALTETSLNLRWTDNSIKTTPTYSVNYSPAN